MHLFKVSDRWNFVAGSGRDAKVVQCLVQFSTHDFILTLDEALRTGAIVRGMDLDESEVQEGERIAEIVRGRVLRSGD